MKIWRISRGSRGTRSIKLGEENLKVNTILSGELAELFENWNDGIRRRGYIDVTTSRVLDHLKFMDNFAWLDREEIIMAINTINYNNESNRVFGSEQFMKSWRMHESIDVFKETVIKDDTSFINTQEGTDLRTVTGNWEIRTKIVCILIEFKQSWDKLHPNSCWTFWQKQGNTEVCLSDRYSCVLSAQQWWHLMNIVFLNIKEVDKW